VTRGPDGAAALGRSSRGGAKRAQNGVKKKSSDIS